MDKVVDFLEKYCQWLAIALGGLFLAWALLAYVLFAPVAVVANGKTFTPGDVDDSVKTTGTDPLENLIKDPDPVQPPKKGTTDLAGQWRKDMSGDVQLAAIPSGWVNSQAGDFKIKNDAGPAAVAAKIMALPTLPAAEVVEAKAAIATVGLAVPAGGVAPAAVAPGQPVNGTDKNYVRMTYQLPAGKIAAAFAAVNIPANITSTSLVHVRLMRQEMQENGTWGPATEVPWIKNGVVIEPLPPANALPGDVNTFRSWAEGPGQTDLLRPTFYPVLLGEGPWDPPADELLPKYDPAAERQKQNELLKARQDAEKAKQDAERAKHPAPAPTTPRAGSTPKVPAPPRVPSRPPGRRSGAARDVLRPGDLGELLSLPSAQFRPPIPPPPPPPPPPPGSNGVPTVPGSPQPYQPAEQATPGSGTPPADPLPPANFQPAALTAPILGWTYDETVVEGHTYRYQVLYTLRNPVYLSNIVANPALSTQFAIESVLDDDAWSPPVKVKPTAEFYLASNNWTESRVPGSIKINVFKWAQGKWQMEPFTVSPGDKIGDKETNVDYETNSTLVDIRYDTRAGQNGRAYVLLLTPDGQLVEREPVTDSKSGRMNQLRQAVQAQATPAGGQPQAAVQPPPNAS